MTMSAFCAKSMSRAVGAPETLEKLLSRSVNEGRIVLIENLEHARRDVQLRVANRDDTLFCFK